MALTFYFLKHLNNSDDLLNNLENSLNTTKNLFEEQKRYALSLSILLSEDQEIVNSFLNNNRVETFNVVNRKIKTLKKLQNSNLEVQIHNKDLSTYLRSWDLSIKDIPLSSFRKGVVKVKEEKKPIVSIELGKRLNIKAISAIKNNGKYVGSLEVIVGFNYLTKQLKQKGCTLYVLLNKKYLNIATNLKDNPKTKDYVLVNSANIDDLKDLNLNNLKDYGYASTKKHSFAYFSYYDLNNKHLGYIFTSILNKNQINLNNSYDYEEINPNKKVQIK
ncbi:two-component sensor kinase [Malaciobacter marinus]|uniref:Two-component sensor kinase n=1 Tax=Malaciobacter marinus TaxID=505249 RepID=A0AB36ZSL5_9BACT|nr:cache domain-containing protein [Malaciobacter marinus]PPK58649.1 two-component sensor kinase [Malaciobacter marinus]